MAGESIPELAYNKPDGSLFTRIEMEEQMRKVWPKIYWVRLKANKVYGLPRQAAFDMKAAFLWHWTLDEMIRRGQVVGDVSGVDAHIYNDEASTRQFIQRLQYLIQAGQALTPQEGEGVDMQNFTPPPPPPMGPPGAPSNGQQQMPYQPPAPQGFAPPMPAGMPQTAPQPQGPPQQQYAPPMQQPQGMPPGAPQYAPPMPGTGMPQMPSTPVPPMPGAPPPQMPPQQTAPQAGGGRRGKRGGDQAAPPQGAAPVPPMPGAPPQQNYAPPAQYGPPGAPPMMPPGGQQGYAPQAPSNQAPPQQQYAPPQQQAAPPVQQAPQVVSDPTMHQKLDQLLANQQQILSQQARLFQEWSVLQTGLGTWLRATYQKPGAPDLRSILAELGIQIPQ